MNKDMTLDAVSLEGYSTANLSMYYAGTYLLYKTDGIVSPAYVRGVEEDYDNECPRFYIRILVDNKLEDVVVIGEAIEECLFRMIIPTGWYLMPRITPFRYEHTFRRTHKKGLNPDHMALIGLDGDHRNVSHKTLEALIHPKNKIGDRWVISRRLLVHNNTIYTAYRGLSVGTIENGKAVTPFPCIQQRMEEL